MTFTIKGIEIRYEKDDPFLLNEFVLIIAHCYKFISLALTFSYAREAFLHFVLLDCIQIRI